MINNSVQTSKIDINATGNVLGAAGTGKSTYIWAIVFTTAGTVTVQISDGTNNFTGAMTCVAGVPIPFDPLPGERPLFTLGAAATLTFTLGSGTQTSGYVQYSVV